jgi:flavin reductase (DIM6/NTAB) family NADH-FMN oxidoreductase RutF
MSTISPSAPVAGPDFIRAMGQHASSVCVITASHGASRHGLTATAVSSVCAEPPRLLVCANKSGITHQLIVASGSFCVNVLTEDQDHIAKAFAGMMGKDFDRFSVGQWSVLATGSPVLGQAAAVFDCEIVQAIDQFTHTIFIGAVVGVASVAGQDPLLYGARRFRQLRKAFSPQLDADGDMLYL